MNYILVVLYAAATIYFFNRKNEYVLATFLVGQPILKMMLKPLPQTNHPNIFLLCYLILGILSVVIVRFDIKHKYTHKPEVKKTFLECFLFAILMCFTLLYSPSKDYGMSKIVAFFTVNGLIIFLVYYTIKNQEDFQRVMLAVSNVAILMGFLTIFIIFLKTGSIVARLGTSAAREIQVAGIGFPVSIWFGRRMGLGFLSMLFLQKITPSLVNKVKSTLLLFLTILSVSRGPIISLVVTLVLMSLINLKKEKTEEKIIKYFFASAFIILFIIVASFGSVDSGVLGRLFTFNDGNAYSRVYLYEMSMVIIKENIFGIGIGGFNRFGGMYSYPHNILLEIMVELGIVGVLYFLMLIFKSFITFFRARLIAVDKTKMTILNFSLAVLIFGLVNGQFSGDLTSNETIWLGIALLAVCKLLVIKTEKNVVNYTVKRRM